MLPRVKVQLSRYSWVLRQVADQQAMTTLLGALVEANGYPISSFDLETFIKMFLKHTADSDLPLLSCAEYIDISLRILAGDLHAPCSMETVEDLLLEMIELTASNEKLG